MLLTEDGKVLNGETAQEGLPEDAMFVSVHSSYKETASAALDNKGNMWVWGVYTPLFFGYSIRETAKVPWCPPSRVPYNQFDGRVVQKIALGNVNAGVIASGCLYMCGWREGGRLGYTVPTRLHFREGTMTKMQHVPIKDERSEDVPIMDIAIGRQSSGVVGCDGSVWTYGPNFEGECGTGDRKTCKIPTRVLLIDAIGDNRRDAVFRAKQISMHSHSVVVASDGSVNVWGNNHFGQLGLGDDKELTCLLPVFLPCVPMRSAACGWKHTLFLTNEGDVFACGCNGHGALGLGARPKTAATYTYAPTLWYAPTRVVGVRNVVSVAAACGTSVAATSGGAVFQWGLHRDQEMHMPELLRLQMRVGLGRSMMSEMALALAMSTHKRLGARSPVSVLCTDTIRKLAEAWEVCPPY